MIVSSARIQDNVEFPFFFFYSEIYQRAPRRAPGVSVHGQSTVT